MSKEQDVQFPARSEGPTRIAIVCASLSRASGGVLPIMQNHANELQELGFDVSAHGVSDDESEFDEAGWNGVKLYRAKARFRPFAYAPGLAEGIIAAKPDLIHQHGLWQYPSTIVNSWRRRETGAVIISTQGMLEPWALSNSGLKKRIAGRLFEWANLRGASALHTSRAELAGVRAYDLNNPVAVIPNGVVVPDGVKPPYPAALPRDGRSTLLFLGRLHPKKGLSETLQAWHRVAQEAPKTANSWRLVIAGWDDRGHAESLQMEAGSLAANAEVIFVGPAFGEDKEALLHHADAFILASHSEGFPMAVLEAFAYSLPVFMTVECNVPEGFAAGAAIRITTDPSEMAAQLKEHLSGPSERLKKIGENGRMLAEDAFSWPAIAQDLAKVYDYVLGHGRCPSCIDKAT